ncbi:MAG: glycerol kinase GlpK [Treponema sp.]|nr:glycerol kinase GlpK [Treponema sp.]
MAKKYVIALDQGTTSSRAIVYDKNAHPIGAKQREFKQYYPQPGWVEHDAEELFKCQLKTLESVLIDNEIKFDEIAAIGITNQRETVVVWDKVTGKPVYHAIVWQCRRTADICEDLSKKGYEKIIKEKTGLLIDAYFSGTKIKWILDNVPGVRERAEKGELLAGTIDTWLIWKLSGGKAHVTDVTNACRTMLFNIYERNWDEELLKLLNIPRCLLPEVHDSSEVYCETDKEICGFSVPIGSAVGDQQAALFGQGCFKKGDAKNTYGTGCFMLMNTGDKPVVSKNLLTTIALGMNGKVEYALEGSVFIGGAVIKWLRDELELISSAPEIDHLAESVPDANGAYLVPAFVGLGTPYWDMYARGTIVGLTRGVKKAHICRAALEGIAFEVRDVLDEMVRDSETAINTLNVDGGACVSDVMMQFQADILNTKVCRPKNVETTALGAAYLAGLAVGFWKSKEEILQRRETERIFEPEMKEERRTALYDGWKKAVERAKGWIDQ